RASLGIAPVYYVRHGRTIEFASELKAFDSQWRHATETFPPAYVWTPEAGLVPGHRVPATSTLQTKARAPYELAHAWVCTAIRHTTFWGNRFQHTHGRGRSNRR